LSVSTASQDNRYQNLNAGGQRVRDLEFALAYAFSDQLRGGVNGASLDGDDLEPAGVCHPGGFFSSRDQAIIDFLPC